MGGLSKCLVIYFTPHPIPPSRDTLATPVGGKCQENDAKVTGGGGGYMIANNGRVFFRRDASEAREFGLRPGAREGFAKTSAINGNSLNSSTIQHGDQRPNPVPSAVAA